VAEYHLTVTFEAVPEHDSTAIMLLAIYFLDPKERTGPWFSLNKTVFSPHTMPSA
jgi:hypothetical protein